MKQLLKTIATLIFVALTFVLLLDPYICPEEESQAMGAPVECCLQCCPRHHLAPPTVNLERALREPLFEKFLIVELIPHSALLADSIFHPPKTLLL